MNKTNKRKSTFKRKVLAGIFFTLLGVGLIHLGQAIFFGRQIIYEEEHFASPSLSPKLDGYTIAFLTDTHDISGEALLEVVQQVNDRSVDLVLLGGDFALRPWYHLSILGQIRAKDGIYGVEGNHDRYTRLFPAMEENGIIPLDNSGVQVREGLYVAGVEDLWWRDPDVQVALEGAGPADFKIVVSHNPDVALERDCQGADFMLAGHTHGGQVTFFGWWAPALTLTKKSTNYGQRFMSGWCEGAVQLGKSEPLPVYVSRGTGWLNSIPRVFASPEVTILTLEAEG